MFYSRSDIFYDSSEWVSFPSHDGTWDTPKGAYRGKILLPFLHFFIECLYSHFDEAEWRPQREEKKQELSASAETWVEPSDSGPQGLHGSFFISFLFLYGKRYADARHIREDTRFRISGFWYLWRSRERMGLRSYGDSPEGKYQESLDPRIRPKTSWYGPPRCRNPHESTSLGRIWSRRRILWRSDRWQENERTISLGQTPRSPHRRQSDWTRWSNTRRYLFQGYIWRYKSRSWELATWGSDTHNGRGKSKKPKYWRGSRLGRGKKI